MKFLVTLKNLLVGVLIASSVMLFAFLYKNDLNSIGTELNGIVVSIHKYGIYFQGEIVVSAVLGLFVSFFISKILLLIEIILGAIGEKKYVPEEKSTFSFIITTIIKSPFQFIYNVIRAIIGGIVIAFFMEAIVMLISASLKIDLNWQVSLVISAWCSAFIGYLWARSQSKVKESLQTES